MSQNSNQAVDAPNLADVGPSGTESSDNNSIYTVEHEGEEPVEEQEGKNVGEEIVGDVDENISASAIDEPTRGELSVHSIGDAIKAKTTEVLALKLDVDVDQLTKSIAHLMIKILDERDGSKERNSSKSEKNLDTPVVMKNDKETSITSGNLPSGIDGLDSDESADDVVKPSDKSFTLGDINKSFDIPTPRSNVSNDQLDSITNLKRLCSDIKRKEFDIDKIQELPYIQDQRPDIEQAFFNYYEELSTMENRTQAQSDDLSYFDVAKFPKYNSVKNVAGLLNWLKRMILFKNAHCIPDYFIRDELESAASRLNNEHVETVVETAIAGARVDDSEPIKYARLLAYLEAIKPKLDFSDLMSVVDKTLKKSNDFRVLMVSLGNVIDSYIRYNDVKDIPKVSWIKIIKKVMRKAPEAMNTIESQIPWKVRIRVRESSGTFNYKEVDGEAVKRELNYIRKRQEKEILKAPFISKDLSIVWGVVMTTYDKIVDGIPWECIDEKTSAKLNSKIEQKRNEINREICKGCGKSNHLIKNCFTLKKLISLDKITESDGKYYDKKTGKLIVVKNGENIGKKYRQDNARQRETVIAKVNATEMSATAVASRTRLKRGSEEVEEYSDMLGKLKPKKVKFENKPTAIDSPKFPLSPIEEVTEPLDMSNDISLSNMELDTDDDDDDDYKSESEEKEVPFKPSQQSMDRELNNLAQAELDYNDQMLVQFLDSDSDSIVTDTSISDVSKTDDTVSLTGTNSPMSTTDDDMDVLDYTLDHGVTEKIDLNNQSKDSTDRIEDSTTDSHSYNSSKTLRKKRVGRYDEPDKNATFDLMFKENIEVKLPLSKMIGLMPPFRKRLHDATRTQLIQRQGPVNLPETYDVNMTSVTKSFDSLEMGKHIKIPAIINKLPVNLLYDPGSQVSLINSEMANRMGLKLNKLNFQTYVQGVHKDPHLVEYSTEATLEIQGLKMDIQLLVVDAIPDGELLLGLPFQIQYKFWVGYNDSDAQFVGFKINKKRYRFTISQLSNDQNPALVHLYWSGVIHNDKLRVDLTKCVSNGAIPSALKTYFINQAMEYDDVFYREGGDTGRLKSTVHPPVKIPLKDHTPWRTKTIPLGPRREAAVKILSEMLDNKQLEFSDATYRNPWFLIPKKDGKYRMLIDLRKLNQHVELEAGHPYSTDDLTSELSGRAFNTLIDVKNAYFQVPLDSSTNDATSFLTPLGLLKYGVLPQGFINSVSEFSNILQKLLKPVATDVISFIDDIAIKGPLVEDLQQDPNLAKKHIDTVIQVFKILSDAGLKINPVKLKVAVDECEFLGYHISPKGKTLICGQVEALKNYPLPLTKRKMQSFLGLVNYYRVLIPGFAALTAPLYELANKSSAENKYQIEWTSATKSRFKSLIKMLTSAPILVPMDFKQQISIHCDASDDTWAGVLQITDENGISRMVQCLSGKFQGSQQRYSIYEKELLSIYNTLLAVHALLVGYAGVIHIFCDNKALTQVLNAPLNNSHYVSRLYKWLNLIRTYNYQVHHVAGSENVIADALTRCDSNDTSPKISYAVKQLIRDFKKTVPLSSLTILVASKAEPRYKNIALKDIAAYHKTLRVPPEYQDKRKLFIYRAHEFYSDNNTLYKIGKDGTHAKRVVSDPQQILFLFHSMHDKRGHPKFPTMFQFFSTRYYIPNLYHKLMHYLRTCTICQKIGGSNERLPLHLNLPVGIFHTIAIDTVFIHDKYLVVARDEFSGWCEARITPKLSGEFVAKFIYEDWICRIGQFKELKSDNGSEFVNYHVKDLLKRFNIKHVVTTPYHPQANGFVEREHQNLIRFLKSLPKGDNWENKLSTALFIDRTTTRSRTGYSPQLLVYGFVGLGSNAVLEQNVGNNINYNPMQLMKLRFRQLHDKELLHRIAQSTQRQKRIQYKEAYDKRYTTGQRLEINDLVLVKEIIRKELEGKEPKMNFKWKGPFRIAKIEDKIFKLKTLDNVPLAQSYTREFLKKFHSRGT